MLNRYAGGMVLSETVPAGGTMLSNGSGKLAGHDLGGEWGRKRTTSLY